MMVDGSHCGLATHWIYTRVRPIYSGCTAASGMMESRE